MRLGTVAALAVGLLIPWMALDVVAQETKPAVVDSLQITVVIERAGIPFAQPTLVARLGEAATMQLGADQDSGFRMTITPSKYNATSYLLKSTFMLGKNGIWTTLGSPTIVMAAGTSARIALGGDQDRADWAFSFDIVERGESWLGGTAE